MELRELRLEVEHLRDQQQALQRDPHSNHSEIRNNIEDLPGHNVDGKNPANGGHFLRWRLRLIFRVSSDCVVMRHRTALLELFAILSMD